MAMRRYIASHKSGRLAPALMNTFRFALGAVVLLLFAAACTGPSGGQDPARPDEPPEDALPEPTAVNLAQYEDFDAAPYRIEPPAEEIDLEHDVPERLMDGQADAGITREVQGFRIQIFASADRAEAEEALTRAIAWWDAAQEDAPELFPEELPVYLRYRQPYYRVRVGDFTSRSRAERALAYIDEQYADAFISPGTVIIEL